MSARQGRRLQYWSERSNYFAGLERSIDTQPAIYLVAKITAVAHHVGGISGGLADRPHAAFFGVL